MIMEYTILIVPFFLCLLMLRDVYLRVCKKNFCRSCKHLDADTYCTHPCFKKHDYVRGTSWSPMAENVRDRNNPYCKHWEGK